MYLGKLFALYFQVQLCVATLCFTQQNNTGNISLPVQEQAKINVPVDAPGNLLIINENTNLVSLLQDIRKQVESENYSLAQEMAKAALEKINQTSQNKFYLQHQPQCLVL